MVIVPTIIERCAASEHIYDLYSCLLKERIIIITGEIDDAMSSSVCAQLLYLSSINNEPIQMYINSPGGSVSAGFAIYDVMQYINCEISTIGMGLCASMAAILLCSGTKGKRSVLENTEIMIHQPLGGMQGQASDMEIATNHIIKIKDKLHHILSSNSNLSTDQIKSICDRDYYMDANKALQLGIVDTIINKN